MHAATRHAPHKHTRVCVAPTINTQQSGDGRPGFETERPSRDDSRGGEDRTAAESWARESEKRESEAAAELCKREREQNREGGRDEKKDT